MTTAAYIDRLDREYHAAKDALCLRWSPKTGHPAKLAANGDKDEQRGWQTKEL